MFASNGRRRVPAASVLKVMFMGAYLRKFAPHRKLTGDDRSLLSPMIRWSDNTTASRISDLLGPKPMYRLARAADMKDFSFVQHPWGLSQVSARDQARFMFRLERYLPNRHEGYARYLLHHIVPEQRWGIGRLKRPDWKIFFKGGWGSGTGWVSHQVAFLERDGMRISAAVMIRDSPSHAYGTETLKGIFARLLRRLPKARSTS